MTSNPICLVTTECDSYNNYIIIGINFCYDCAANMVVIILILEADETDINELITKSFHPSPTGSISPNI